MIAIIGLVGTFALPRWSRWSDRFATDRAAREVASFYGSARFAAIQRSTRVRMQFSTDSLVAIYEGVRDSTFLWWPGPVHLGVVLRASRAVIRVYPNGIGLGAANTKIVVSRGAAAESLTTSRLGRIKRWR